MRFPISLCRVAVAPKVAVALELVIMVMLKVEVALPEAEGGGSGLLGMVNDETLLHFWVRDAAGLFAKHINVNLFEVLYHDDGKNYPFSAGFFSYFPKNYPGLKTREFPRISREIVAKYEAL